MKNKLLNSAPAIFILPIAFCLFWGGCSHLQGNAAYWYQGPEDEEPKVKQVGLDTQDLVQRDRQAAGITS